MEKVRTCDYCGDTVDDQPIVRGDGALAKVYCCEACAFEASRSTDCGGRTDSTVAGPVIER